MKILGLDTATRATSVALADCAEPESAGEARDDPPRGERPRHTAMLLPLVQEVLARSGAGWDGVDRIAVGVGPGTFTGLRIGIATARALGQARDIPLVPVSTLRALAMNAPGEAVLAVLDARRGEVFAAAYRGDGTEVLAPAAYRPEALAAAAPPCLAIGEGAVEFRAVLERSGAAIPEDDSKLHRVDARHHCALACALEPVATADIRPQYLRLPDAELNL